MGPLTWLYADTMSLKGESGKVILFVRPCILHEYHLDENLHNLSRSLLTP